MADRGPEATHRDPVWRERADFIIGAVLDDEQGTEQLFSRQLGPRRFELCCIPFFTYGLALGDVVETDDDFTVSGVVQPSGHRTIRVWFGDTFLPRDEFTDSVKSFGVEAEWSSSNLLAISAPDELTVRRVVDLVEQRTADGLVWEFG